jgi:hypothetical protein
MPPPSPRAATRPDGVSPAGEVEMERQWEHVTQGILRRRGLVAEGEMFYCATRMWVVNCGWFTIIKRTGKEIFGGGIEDRSN